MMADINDLQGTAGSSISLNFTSFEIGDDANCYNDFIEVKTYGLTLEGPRYDYFLYKYVNLFIFFIITNFNRCL